MYIVSEIPYTHLSKGNIIPISRDTIYPRWAHSLLDGGLKLETVLGLGDIVEKIVYFGFRFETEYLSKEYLKSKDCDIEKIEEDWWEALKFFLTRAFYQGRRDDVSEKVERTALRVLRKHFHDPSKREDKFQALMASNWEPLKKDLKSVIGKGKVGRGRDVDMTIETFNFLSKIPHKNIVGYSTKMIRDGKLKDLWTGLQKAEAQNGIRSVGTKIASLYLRDLVVILGLENTIDDDNQVFLQPVDTWVRQVTKEIGLPETEDEMKLRKMIIERCRQADQSAIKFNEGAWYVGAHSLEILWRF